MFRKNFSLPYKIQFDNKPNNGHSKKHVAVYIQMGTNGLKYKNATVGAFFFHHKGRLSDKVVSLQKTVRNIFIKMKRLDGILRELQEEKQASLRIIAAYFDIYQPILNGIGQGKWKMLLRKVINLDEYFNVNKNKKDKHE
jgi:hypothetical protein